jgi:hypothetical protein
MNTFGKVLNGRITQRAHDDIRMIARSQKLPDQAVSAACIKLVFERGEETPDSVEVADRQSRPIVEELVYTEMMRAVEGLPSAEASRVVGRHIMAGLLLLRRDPTLWKNIAKIKAPTVLTTVYVSAETHEFLKTKGKDAHQFVREQLARIGDEPPVVKDAVMLPYRLLVDRDEAQRLGLFKSWHVSAYLEAQCRAAPLAPVVAEAPVMEVLTAIRFHQDGMEVTITSPAGSAKAFAEWMIAHGCTACPIQ